MKKPHPRLLWCKTGKNPSPMDRIPVLDLLGSVFLIPKSPDFRVLSHPLPSLSVDL